MDWSHELWVSAVWLAQAYALTVAALAGAAYGVVRGTVWGRQFGHLLAASLTGRQLWRAAVLPALLLLTTLMEVRLGVLFGFFNNSIFSALQQFDAQACALALWAAVAICVARVLRAVAERWVREALEIHWRSALNTALLQRWMHGQAYYRLQHTHGVDNPDQRIQQDVTAFVDLSVNLCRHLINAMVSLVAYSIVLWGLAGTLQLLGVALPHGMLFLAYGYVALMTAIALRVGRPLVRLNFANERHTADYRYALVRVRDHAESIAFYRGEAVETRLLGMRFHALITSQWALVRRSVQLLGVNGLADQATMVLPLLIQVPRFLAREISLGDVVQTGHAFSAVQSALSFFRTFYDDFAHYRAVLQRLDDFLSATAPALAEQSQLLRGHGTDLQVHGLAVYLPTGRCVVAGLALRLQSGQSLLVRGASGVGKTTLLRTLAGLWPYACGAVSGPVEPLFLPQNPYLPLGSLRAALHYPRTVPLDADAQLLALLQDCQLAHLGTRLDADIHADLCLSPGERQRLAFVRVLLARPALVFLDEATSALDEALEQSLYRLLRSRLPTTIVFSVGHRTTLRSVHDQTLLLDGDGGWSLTPISLMA